MRLADMDPDALYSVDEVAEALHLCVDSVYRMGRSGVLPSVPLGPRGGRLKWYGKVVIAYVQQKAA